MEEIFEDAIFTFMKCLSTEELKRIYSPSDILERLNHYNEAEQDLRELAWELLRDSVNYTNLITKIQHRILDEELKDQTTEAESEAESEPEEDEEEEGNPE